MATLRDADTELRDAVMALGAPKVDESDYVWALFRVADALDIIVERLEKHESSSPVLRQTMEQLDKHLNRLWKKYSRD